MALALRQRAARHLALHQLIGLTKDDGTTLVTCDAVWCGCKHVPWHAYHDGHAVLGAREVARLSTSIVIGTVLLSSAASAAIRLTSTSMLRKIPSIRRVPG